jgi:eukaryotic-like serine/threonine-protein kinase
MQNSSARAAIDVGSVIAGTYTIEALIGRGGMGAVFLASHARLPGKKVAIKVLHAELGGDEILARFKREAQIASMLSHPNIVHIEDYNVTAEGMPYLVLEYLQGESLAGRLKRGPLSIEEAFSIMRQVGSALAAAHAKGIVHRDLKPQNIFLLPSEIEGRTLAIAKVLDFGISKMRDSQTVKTQDSALLGTPQYMAPEQAMGQHANVDERTDIFALGAIVYEMLCGNPAFSGASIPEVVFKVVYEQPTALGDKVPSLPVAIAAAVHRAMSKPSGERFSSVSAFIEALTGSPLPPPRPSNSVPPPLEDGGGATGPRTPNNSGREAFAQTLGSVPPGLTATMPPRDPLPSAETLPSTPPPVATPPSVQAHAPTVDAKPKSKAPLFAGGSVVAIVAIVAIVAMTKKKPAEQVAKQEPPPPVVIADAAVVMTPPLDAAIAVDAAVPVDAAVKKHITPPQPPQPPPPPDDNGDDEGDAASAEKLRQAEEALRAGQWPRAEQLANAVLNSEDAKPKQKARGAMIHGMVQCLGRNNEEGALTDLRRMKGNYPFLRRRLLTACQKAGFLVQQH